MIVTVDLGHTAGYNTSESDLNYLIDTISKYSNKEKFYTISMIMSNSTYNICYSDLHSAFGDMLNDITTICPDQKIPFGVIYFFIKDGRTGITLDRGRSPVFSEEHSYDLTQLKDDIVAQSPKFLITNMSTWGLINDLDFENTDKYGNQVDYYHSYYKVPVALSEFVSTGQVLLVK